MAESVMVGTRVPVAWQEKIRAIAQLSGRTESQIIREALSQYLGLVDPSSLESTMENHERRLAKIEDLLSRFR